MTAFVARLLISVTVLAVTVPGAVAFVLWYERRALGRLQARIGPNRVGPQGLFQSVADIFKLLVKEDIIPSQADRWLFILAPLLAFAPAFLVFVAIPFGPGLVAANLNVGVLWIISVSSLSVLGAIMAGWGSNSKYSLLGGMRSAAQLITYEIPIGLAIVGVVMATGSLQLDRIVAAQQQMWFFLPQILGFVAYLICAVAEVQRTPFDLGEAESELVAGYHTEYSSFRFALFILAEYVHLILESALAVLLFLGGWAGPVLPPLVWFILKTGALIFFMVWLRATMPRIRIDQLMSFGWKAMLPLSLVNILVTGILQISHL